MEGVSGGTFYKKFPLRKNRDLIKKGSSYEAKFEAKRETKKAAWIADFERQKVHQMNKNRGRGAK